MKEIISHLVSVGLKYYFIAPGSRSSPIVSAVVHNQETHRYLGIDERSLAFMALGYAKSSGLPAAVIVTSGTAVANLMPAVVEAYLSHVPMVLLTADRPFELRDTGANQTINQAHMFTNHICYSCDVAPPSPDLDLRLYRAIFGRAYHMSLAPKRGPVHINIQIRQ